VQELLDKCNELPADIHWHLIGHLQTNKVRQVIPFVTMISSVDSVRLLHTLQKEAAMANRRVDVLVQIKISSEATKYGFDPETVIEELTAINVTQLPALRFRGVMGMASFVDDSAQVHREFNLLKTLFDDLKKSLFQDEPQFDQICMGMSGDYRIAIAEGSTMVRIGSLIFGERK
jgi:pyridoxal phosphate enzyme (YggS family)